MGNRRVGFAKRVQRHESARDQHARIARLGRDVGVAVGRMEDRVKIVRRSLHIVIAVEYAVERAF